MKTKSSHFLRLAENHMARHLKNLTSNFETEKRLKNEAFYFILSKGLLEDYRTFIKNYRESGRDPHKDCYNYFERIAE